MDNALQSLSNTLDAINSRQAAARRRARKGGDATPFTSAVLNREGLEIYTYIRDADPQTEANLFWYPPLPQSASASRAGPSSSTHRSAHLAPGRTNGGAHINEDASEADLLLAPRLPEPRHVAPPTPLRNTNASNKQTFQSQSAQGVDPRVLLQAAQRLNATCGKGSRTRKHIKGLIKTHASLNQAIKAYEQQIRQSENQLRLTAQGKPIGASQVSSTSSETPHLSNTDAATDEIHAHISEVQEAIQKEQLEILALEEMIAELRQARLDRQKQELEKQQRAETAAELSKVPSQSAQTSRRSMLPRHSLTNADQADATAQHAAQESDPVADDEDQELLGSRVDLTHQDEEEQVQQLQHSPEPQYEVYQRQEPDVSLAREQHNLSTTRFYDDTPDLTVQQPREAEPVESFETQDSVADTSAAIDPVSTAEEATVVSQQSQQPQLLAAMGQSSDALQRVTQKVWEVFGDALRSVAPGREGADYHDTLDLLKALMTGGDKPNAGDYSVGSVQTSSTLSTAASEASAAASAQLTPEVLMTAFVIFQMLVSEEPHRMNIDQLKVRGHEWWSTSGMQVWLHARSHDENHVPIRAEAFEDGQNLARKATYGMISKQLFAIKRQKGVGLVGFA
ncbi:uncharacterized protein UHOD_06643 [Ustilago sp. UG-2017b]|nr:uncharacterized protein UHOD_06643 [Ustilago sp. UG-2017b]